MSLDDCTQRDAILTMQAEIALLRQSISTMGARLQAHEALFAEQTEVIKAIADIFLGGNDQHG